ncbi:MAG: hypothetical protein KZQ66_20190 [Candidatus Thiodiazotropha sp. (ex Lucinoma aequizonata)]|nr:hypothetical protein [Candidatus Thiodiazotropha sp. (ex Lucinoma aequizonata)]MCU7887880.1 hypothetical protein [Candidatus Thiodiazotropha sp. (ex Lucinoma aequizonata)]MCU7895058.1 hypothetical protein [Candidatus Thiodiazotropha sp. (ex Lucinoma aequizonata)]MCU7897245.1 hypothetical protein [Candidatus Thiodiazotropha sp. (ex Lucinoma aequizonata)]MCU7904010.1 hypothetical protein [Candidatus Thiodiazotropha sp. (ex Lucinoma aequizonata)]
MPITHLKIFISINLGTSGCRAIAIDETGAVKSVMTRLLPLSDGKKPGRRQQKPEHWWQAVIKLLRKINEACDNHSIAAIAVDGTSSTLLLTDLQGNPAHPSIDVQRQP